MTHPSLLRQAFLVSLAALLLALAQAGTASDEPMPRILVTGEGSVDIAPDMAIVNLSVMREAQTARAAMTANNEAMRKVLDAMQAQGIAERDLQTSNFDIQPRYSYPQPGGSAPVEPRLVGYIVRNAITVRVRDLARLGEVLDTAVTLGVNEGGNIQFTNDDPSAAISQARVKATKNALQRARELADAAGVKLGEILEIAEQNYSPGPMPMAKVEMTMAAAPDAAPVASGENSYRVAVNLSVAIAP